MCAFDFLLKGPISSPDRRQIYSSKWKDIGWLWMLRLFLVKPDLRKYWAMWYAAIWIWSQNSSMVWPISSSDRERGKKIAFIFQAWKWIWIVKCTMILRNSLERPNPMILLWKRNNASNLLQTWEFLHIWILVIKGNHF